MFRVNNNFEKLLDKATSNLRLDPDWPTILQICDLIRQNDCSPKYAVAAIKKKLSSPNPHQAMFALLVLESVVKNCGSGIHDEVGSKAFCESLRELVKTTQHENLKNKILELIQAWAFAFRNSHKYRAVQDTVNILKTEGFKFPPLKESDAMFSADTAPEWADGEVCHRCRVAFSLIVRRHHCRACGQVFCQQCSSKTSTLPKFGIEKEVRVCDACYDKVSRPPTSTAKLEINDTSNDYGPTTQTQKRPPGKTAEELQEEEELQLALALSQSEAEHKEKEKERRTRTHSHSHVAPDPTPHTTLSPTPSSVSASPEHSTGANPELSRYLDRGYWEQRLSRDSVPTAPTVSTANSEATDAEYGKPAAPKTQEDDAEDKEIDEFVETLKNQVEIFVNRMKSNSSRGRSIANDTSVQTLFMNITAMHSRLLRYIQQQDDKRVYLESLQDKVNQVRDSRAALDTLRAEHAARLAAQAEAAERQRQMQMAAKLQAMRKKKHEYLQYQRQLALQRVQEQEREMQMRQEQQKHQYMMTANSYYMPGVSMHQYQPGFMNQPMYANAQFHPQMIPQATTDGSVIMPGQPQMSQAGLNPGSMTQSMPQLNNSFAMSTSGMTISQPPISVQSSMNQPNVRPAMNQQLPLQQQLILQQMHQLRMSNHGGVHQMMPQNMPNGLPGQNMQQNEQSPAKQNVPNQQQQQNPMLGSQTVNQQPAMNPNNPMHGMQMPNMRNPQVPGYSISLQNQSNHQPGSQPQSMPPQMAMPGQPMPLPSQQMIANQLLHGQPPSMHIPSHISSTQNMPSQGPQASQSQHQPPQPSQTHIGPNPSVMQQGQQVMPDHGQHMMPQHQGQNHGQQMIAQMPQNPQTQQMVSGHPNPMQPPSVTQQLPHIVGQVAQMPQHISPGQPHGPQVPQGQQIPHGQQIPQSQQQISHGQPGSHGQQISQGQQIPHGPQLSQNQQIPQHLAQGSNQQVPQSQGQQMPQPQSMPGQTMSQVPIVEGQHLPAQQMKMQVQNFSNGPPGQQPPPHQPAPVKSESNNNTAELISFD